MLLDIPDTLQISTHVLTGRVAGLSRKSNMDICSNPTGSGVNHVAIDLTLFLCACYNANMLPTYPYVTCRLNIVSTSVDTVFGRVTDMSATCRADTHVSVNSTIFSTFKNPTFPAKVTVCKKCYKDNLKMRLTALLFDPHRRAPHQEVLRHLCDAGLKVNAEILTLCALETEYLGYILTRDGIKPQSNQVQAILAIQPSTNVKQLRHFLGMVQYYCDCWARRSKMLAPLTSLVGECGQTKVTRAKGTKKVPWHWDEVHQRAFDHVKATIAREVVLAYPDYSKVFEIYTDASSKQLGAVTTQENRPIVFFCRKLSTTQCKYSVTKIELLATVETLKEFKGMLWGQSIKVYTDHDNLIRDAIGMTLYQVYQWRLLLED
jgi:hypothetical protein